MTSSASAETSTDSPGGRAVFADASARALLARRLGELAEPASHGWQQVKRNDSRTVWRGSIEGRQIYLKHFHGRKLARRLKRAAGMSDAAVEMRFSQYLSDRGVPTPRVLAASYDGPQEWLATEAVVDAQPAGAWHERQLAAGAAGQKAVRRAAAELARMIARMHAAGVIHRDLHCGNVLVSHAGSGKCKLVLMDLHRMRRRRRLSRKAMADNLARLLHDRRQLTTRSERLRFLKHYLAASGAAGTLRGWHWLIERAAGRHTPRQHAKRERAAMGRSRYFSPLRLGGGWRAQVVLASRRRPEGSRAAKATFTAADWAQALSSPAELLTGPGAAVVKDSASSLVVRRTLNVGPHSIEVYVKRHRRKRRWKLLLDCFRRSRAKRAFRLGHALLTRRIDTALPLAALERRAGPFLLDSILITEAVDCPPLNQFLKAALGNGSGPAPSGQAGAVARQVPARLGRLLQRLHDEGFAHRDLKAGNMLVRWPAPQGARVVLVDLDGLKRCRRLSARRRFQGLMRLNVSLLECPAVNRAGRLRMLLGYLRRCGCGRINFKPYWRMLDEWSARKRRSQIRSRRMRQRAARRPAQ